ncbi:hypothetical protein FHG87_017311 [Trinorchestia longiramus]|nr:hypothetical protein FHG87_017311 [Trinorchestia longiramus]
MENHPIDEEATRACEKRLKVAGFIISTITFFSPFGFAIALYTNRRVKRSRENRARHIDRRLRLLLGRRCDRISSRQCRRSGTSLPSVNRNGSSSTELKGDAT